MKVIFLDIDGVMVNRESLIHSRGGFIDTAHADCVAALNRIIEATGAKIVISSSWRAAFSIEEMREVMINWGVRNFEIIGETPWINGYVQRGYEIESWLLRWKETQFEEIESFVILDDCDDMAHLMERLVRTNFKDGLSEVNADSAITILNELPWNGTTPIIPEMVRP